MSVWTYKKHPSSPSWMSYGVLHHLHGWAMGCLSWGIYTEHNAAYSVLYDWKHLSLWQQSCYLSPSSDMARCHFSNKGPRDSLTWRLSQSLLGIRAWDSGRILEVIEEDIECWKVMITIINYFDCLAGLISFQLQAFDIHNSWFCLTHLALVPHICVGELRQSVLVQVMACRLLGGKPLPEPMLIYCQLDLQEQTSVKFRMEIQNLKMHENAFENVICQNGGHFVQGDICSTSQDLCTSFKLPCTIALRLNL